MFSASAFAAEGRNLALGARYSLQPTARYDLTQDAGDDWQLTDGRYAGGHFWTSREAVGWVESGPIRIEIDLGEVRSLNRVCFNTARGNHAGVSFPERVDILVSQDRKLYTHLGDAYQGKAHEEGAYLVQKFCAANLAAAGRYVLLAVQPRGGFTFMDEIEVLGGAGMIAANSQTDDVTQIKRADIEEVLKKVQGLAHRKEALLRQVSRMQSDQVNMKPAIRNQLRSFSSRLGREPVSQPDALDKAEEDLLALHRQALSGTFTEPLIVWRKSPWASFSQLDTPIPGTLINGGLDFDLMRSGSTSNALVLTNNSDRMQRFKVEVTPEGDADEMPQFEIREVSPVLASNHEMIGDALKPLENGTISIRPGESRQVWLTVLAGASAPGDYLARASVTSVTDNLPPVNIALRAKVWAAAFPDRQHVYVNTWAYASWRPIEKFPVPAMHDLFAHHANVVVLDAPEVPWPRFRGGEGDYAKSDRILKQYKGTQKRLFFLNFNDSKWRSFGGKYEFMSATWKTVFRKWVKEWVAHLKSQGLDYRDFAFYPVDEPERSELVSYLLETASLIKEIDPEIQVFTTIGKPVGGIDLLRLSRVVDIFQLNVRFLSHMQKTVLAGLNKEIWTYAAYDGGKRADPHGYYRLQAWKAFSNGLTGIGFWAYADTGPSGTAWDDFDGTRPDYAVIYDGRNGPVGSKRWEAWREGVEDYELLALARQKLQPGKEVTEFETRVSSVINAVSDYRQFEIIRRYLLSVASR